MNALARIGRTLLSDINFYVGLAVGILGVLLAGWLT